ncbi:protein-disulfide reductase DsbD domain-containing protein [Cytophaga aurantiaca]|uniref:protein-disulfide reductase DsbD domain-containing protein n=1 Tax=Cytophaga aurantiaca TaxID=29530 RepID=UPI0003A71CD4|nr:protein-disulfide reductase DsbD domain-containing protein [Cytophaga aurantiaca]
MKRIIVLAFCLLSLLTQAENVDPVKWSFSLSSKEIHIGDTIEVIATASIIPDWYVYSNDFDPNLGPTITKFQFAAENGYKLLGNTKAIKPKKKYSSIWEGDVTYFVEHAEFRQKIIILNDAPKIALTVDYQTCNDVLGRCIPGDAEFEFTGLTILPAKKITKSSVGQTDPGLQGKPAEGTVKTNDKASLKSLEAEKKKLIQRDAQGNDVSVDYLKSFVKKYSK